MRRLWRGLEIFDVFAVLFCFLSPGARADEAASALAGFNKFINLSKANSPQICNRFSEYTKDSLSRFIANMASKEGTKVSASEVRKFLEDTSNPEALDMWRSATSSFAEIDLGTPKVSVKGGRAYIMGSSAAHPIVMVKEKGQWNLGLVETLEEGGMSLDMLVK